MSMRPYSQKLIDHYHHPLHSGKLSEFTLTSKVENLTCGDSCEFFIKLASDQVEEIGHISEGCAICVASASLLSEAVLDQSVAEVQKLTKQDILTLLETEIKVSRHGCALLPLQALQKAIASS